MIECPFCDKKYKSRFWLENHLLLKHRFVKKKSIRTYFLDALIVFLVGMISYFTFYADPSFLDLFIWPKLRVDFYDEIKYVDNESVILIDLTNEGGIDLHNIKASLNIVCVDGYNINKIDYGTSIFDKPSYHLLKNSPPKQIYFRNEKLIDRLQNQEGLSCYDSFFIVYEFKQDSGELNKIYLFSYLEEDKSIESEEFDDYENVNFTLCWYCDYNLEIISDEKNFSSISKKKHDILTIFPTVSSFSEKYYYEYVGNGKISCISCAIKKIISLYPKLNFLNNWNLTQENIWYKNCTGTEKTWEECKDIKLPVYGT